MPTAAFTLALLMLAALPLGQATPVAGDAEAIPPVVWELVAYTDAGSAGTPIAEPERYTVQFLPEGELAIDADCNSAGASYTAGDGTLEISPIRSTLILCPPDSQVEPFLLLLETATAYEIDPDGMLLLTGPDGALELGPALTAVLWEWREFSGGDDSVVAPENPEKYTLAFLPEGKLAIEADCNRATGTYEADGPSLSLSIGGTTRATCAPGSLMERFLRDLGHVSSHVFRDGHLYLALKADAGIMEFKARAAESLQATPVAG